MKTEYKTNAMQEAWLQALESGQYKQVTGTLASKKPKSGKIGYCCLGVACEVYNERAKKLRKRCVLREIQDEEASEKVFLFDNEEVSLPSIINTQLKLRDDVGTLKTADYTNNKYYDSLADMNDGGWSHKRIAAYIRANPENVFSDAVASE
jgi:hypothetical protein